MTQAAHRQPTRINDCTYTGDPMLDLVAAIFRRALRDAVAGRRDTSAVDAEIFLDVTFPEWRKFQMDGDDDET